MFSTEGDDFIIDATRSSSDSESDTEVPTFHLSAFTKYDYSESENIKRDRKDLHSSSKITEKKEDVYVNVYPDADTTQDRVTWQKKILEHSLLECEQKNLVSRPGFETLEQVPTFLSRRQSKKLGMKEKEKTKGFQWYNMQAPEMTEEQKNNLVVIQMRQALDPKHFYKRSAVKTNPKYFEVGTYMDSPVDFYSSRIPNKQRKRTLVEELMADAEFRNYQKKKMKEVIHMQPKKIIKKGGKKLQGKKKSTNTTKKQKVNKKG